MFLEQIISHKKDEVRLRRKARPLEEVEKAVANRPTPRDFYQSLKKNGQDGPAIIAEIKKASPSRGLIRADFDPQELGKVYQKGGAAAISVLTDQKFFQGDLGFLALVRSVTDVPLLCKDFIIDPYQIYAAAEQGADGFLLIAAVLSQNQLAEFLSLGQSLGMKALVETHNPEDLGKALQTRAEIIGINNRDLRTFKTDVATTLELIKGIPPDKLVVSESGIRHRNQIERLAQAGVQAFLIGEALMEAQDPGQKLQELRRKLP